MGYVPPRPPTEYGDYGEQIMGRYESDAPFRANLDRHGMPRDYATYEWLLYGKVVEDDSPARRAFLQRPTDGVWPTRPDPGRWEMR